LSRIEEGKLEQLEAVHVDTGMGLERILSVLNGRTSNYDTDLFEPLFQIIHQQTHYEGNNSYQGTMSDSKDAAYRVIADHVRAIVIAVSDDCFPSKVDAGFCLRKLIRRVHVLLRETFQQKSSAHLIRILIDQVIESLSQAYPQLTSQRDHIQSVVIDEILLFQSKMKAARKHVKKMCAEKAQADIENRWLTGMETLRLQKKFGLPKESIEHLIKDYSFQVRWDEFDRLIQEDHKKTLIGQSRSIAK
jgi:alanyl-tRNA synthetase